MRRFLVKLFAGAPKKIWRIQAKSRKIRPCHPAIEFLHAVSSFFLQVFSSKKVLYKNLYAKFLVFLKFAPELWFDTLKLSENRTLMLVPGFQAENLHVSFSDSMMTFWYIFTGQKSTCLTLRKEATKVAPALSVPTTENCTATGC